MVIKHKRRSIPARRSNSFSAGNPFLATVKTIVKIKPQAVKRAVNRGKDYAMKRGAAIVRQTARQNVLRRRKRVSAPGTPPSIHHTGRGGLREIFFVYDSTRGEAMIGPLKYNKKSFDKLKSDKPTLPNLLEFGGVINSQFQKVDVAAVRSAGGQFVSHAKVKYRWSKFAKPRRVRVQPRPFMSVALDKEIKKGSILNAWKGAVMG